nr:zinc ABC transporter substrate-binding protein [Bacteroidota bacterium]
AYFVHKIAGDLAEVVVLIPPGTSPHLYDPNPQQMLRISDASIFFYNGNLAFEKAWLENMGDTYPGMLLVNLSKDILPIETECDHSSGDEGSREHDHDMNDPHDWLSIKNAVVFAALIKNTLVNLFPEDKAVFEQNYIDFKSELESLMEEVSGLLDDIPSRSFMIFHPSLSYFARDFDLVQIPIEFEGKDPTPSRIIKAINLAKSSGIKTIFVQKEFDVENAKVIASEINGKIVQIDPLSIDWDDNLLFIAQSIKNSFHE